MGTKETAVGIFCPDFEENETWMDEAFGMVGK